MRNSPRLIRREESVADVRDTVPRAAVSREFGSCDDGQNTGALVRIVMAWPGRVVWAMRRLMRSWKGSVGLWLLDPLTERVVDDGVAETSLGTYLHVGIRFLNPFHSAI